MLLINTISYKTILVGNKIFRVNLELIRSQTLKHEINKIAEELQQYSGGIMVNV